VDYPRPSHGAPRSSRPAATGPAIRATLEPRRHLPGEHDRSPFPPARSGRTPGAARLDAPLRGRAGRRGGRGSRAGGVGARASASSRVRRSRTCSPSSCYPSSASCVPRSWVKKNSCRCSSPRRRASASRCSRATKNAWRASSAARRSPADPLGPAARRELYELENDPRETRDLAPTAAARVALLAEALARYIELARARDLKPVETQPRADESEPAALGRMRAATELLVPP